MKTELINFLNWYKANRHNYTDTRSEYMVDEYLKTKQDRLDKSIKELKKAFKEGFKFNT